MSRFILTEEDKRYIQSLYNINEQNEEKSVLGIQKRLKELARELDKPDLDPGPLDGKWGSKTAAAYEAFLKSRKDGTDSTQTASDSAEKPATEEDKQMERIALEKEKSTAKDLEQDLNQLKTAITNQPTKEQCIELIATAKVGIKRGVKLTDTSTLGQCFNSYNFIGGGSNMVKKHYGLKGRGN